MMIRRFYQRDFITTQIYALSLLIPSPTVWKNPRTLRHLTNKPNPDRISTAIVSARTAQRNGAKQKIPDSIRIRDLMKNLNYIYCGTTRNRNLTISGWISLMYLLAKEVISRYCSTGLLQRSASGCVEVSFTDYKYTAFFWMSGM